MSKARAIKQALIEMAGAQWVRVPDIARAAGCTTVYAHNVIRDLELKGRVEVHRGSENVGEKIRPVNYVRIPQGGNNGRNS